MAQAGGKRGAKTKFERGASAVEFALIFPLVIAFVFSIVEAGWALEQRHDVREDAQNLAREASINFAQGSISDMDAIVAANCTELDLRDDAVVMIDLPDGTDVGDRIEVTVTQDLEQVTGFFDNVLGGKKVTSTAWAQLEQEAAYSGVSAQQCDGTPVATPTPTPVPTATSTPIPGPTATPTAVPTATPTAVPTATPTAGPTPTPAPTATPTPTPAATATPTPTPIPTCTVPDFDDERKNDATGSWNGAGFSTTPTFLPGSGNYRIHFQSLAASADEPCTSDITLGP